MARFYTVILLLLITQTLMAQRGDSLIMKHSSVKTLTDEEYNAILAGEDINNTAYVALANQFPLPEHVLKYQHELNLTAVQVTQLNDIVRTLKLKKAEVGISVIRNENMLDSMFRNRKLNEGSIIFYTNRYGLYQGEYRGALLLACYNTRRVLTSVQLNKFDELRRHN